MPRSTASAGVVSCTLWPSTRRRAAVVRREAGQRAGQLLAARADHAGDAEDLAGMELEAHVAIGVAERQSLGLEHDVRRDTASAAARGNTRPAGCGRPSADAACGIGLR